MKLADMKEAELKTNELPFIKRYGYRGEEEYRITYESKSTSAQAHDVPITLSSIEAILLSPWLPKELRNSVTSLLRSIEGCKKLLVNRSTLIKNKRWMDSGEFAA